MNLYKGLSHTNGYIHSSNLKGNRNAFNLLKQLLEKGEVEKGEKGEEVVNETHKNQYSIGKLQKLNVIAIKEIAKNLNIVLSMNCKQKTKEQFIKDILTKN